MRGQVGQAWSCFASCMSGLPLSTWTSEKPLEETRCCQEVLHGTKKIGRQNCEFSVEVENKNQNVHDFLQWQGVVEAIEGDEKFNHDISLEVGNFFF